MSNIFELAFNEALEKVANPAAPMKSSKGGMERDEGPSAAYLNMGGGKAGKHVAGSVESKPQPWPGHVNIGDKSPGQQVAGDVDNRGGAPDTGERGTTMNSGDMNMSKSAAFDMGVEDAVTIFLIEELDFDFEKAASIGGLVGAATAGKGKRWEGAGRGAAYEMAGAPAGALAGGATGAALGGAVGRGKGALLGGAAGLLGGALAGAAGSGVVAGRHARGKDWTGKKKRQKKEASLVGMGAGALSADKGKKWSGTGRGLVYGLGGGIGGGAVGGAVGGARGRVLGSLAGQVAGGVVGGRHASGKNWKGQKTKKGKK